MLIAEAIYILRIVIQEESFSALENMVMLKVSS